MNWILLGIFSFATGSLYLKFLTVHPLRINIYLNLFWISVILSITQIVSIPIRENLWLGLGCWGMCMLGGYSITTVRFLNREDTHPLPEIKRQKNDPGAGHTAVIYFTHGEPETYDPIAWLNQFREFDEQKVSFIPYLIRPFFVYQLRKKYLKVGMSKHHQNHQHMVKQLEDTFREEGDLTTRFYLSFLDDNPRPDAAFINAINDGASRVIVAEVFVSISNHTLEGKNLIDRLHLEQWGIPVLYTGPLWNSRTLHQMFVERAVANLGGSDKNKIGILLVGHGQPDEWDRAFMTETEHEVQFRKLIINLLEGEGFSRKYLSMAWMEFKKPKPAEIIEEFIQNGAEKILYFSAAISADSIHSQFDVPELVEKARVPEGTPMINLGAWNDDPLVIRAIKEKIQPLL